MLRRVNVTRFVAEYQGGWGNLRRWRVDAAESQHTMRLLVSSPILALTALRAIAAGLILALVDHAIATLDTYSLMP